MAAIMKWSIVVFALSRAIISPCYAKLPDITAAELLKAVKHGDSLYRNVDCKYTIDNQLNKAVWASSGIPLKRKLEIHWRSEGIRNYIDVTTHDGKFVNGKPVRHVLTFNGKIRMQWTPNENKGCIFKKRYKHGMAVPIDFGLTLGKRERKLGESLAECEIASLRQEKWQGHECYFIEAIQSDGTKAEVWIDPKIGWRARRLRMWDPDGLILRYSSAEFKDCGNGAWYPVDGIFKYYANDRSSGERVVSIERRLKVEQVKVNADLTIKDFEIQYPRGTRVFLYDSKESYIAGVTSVAGFGEEALNPLKDKPLPDIKQLAIVHDPNETKDKMILVCFFDMDQRPSRNCMRQLSAKAQELKTKGALVVAVHASKVDDNKLRLWVQKYHISFPVGMIKTDTKKTRIAWGVRSLPRLILTDRKRMVCVEGFGIEELDEELKKAEVMTAKQAAPTNNSDLPKSFMDAEAILANWESSYLGIRTMRVSYCTQLVDYQPPPIKPDIDMGNLVKYQHVQRVEDGKRYHIRFSKAEDGFDRPESLTEHVFNGKITQEYFGSTRDGSIFTGLEGTFTETVNDLKAYMLLETRHTPIADIRAEYPNGAPELSIVFKKGMTLGIITVRPNLESLAGELCHVVEVALDGRDHKGIPRQIKQLFWMAHDKGMCLMKYQWHWDNRLDREIEVKQIAMTDMAGTGIWYPVKAYRTKYDKEVGTMKYEMTVTDFVPNVEVDENTFRLDFIEGTQISDSNSRKSYTWRKGMKFIVDEWNNSIHYVPKDWSILVGVGKPLPQFEGIKLNLPAEQAESTAILLCFFDMDQRPSRNCITQLVKQAAKLKDKGIVSVAVQSSKTDENALREWVKKYNIPFRVGMVQDDQENIRFNWGIRSLPWLILTDKEHVVTAEGFNLIELDEKLNGNSH